MKLLNNIMLFLLALLATPAKAGVDAYLGEVMLVGFNFCPRDTVPADGQLMAISSNTALFSLYGTYYGGDGRTTFGIPDLRGRAPIHVGTGPGLAPVVQGQRGGSEMFVISAANMPNHNHTIRAVNDLGNKHGPGGDFLAIPNTDDKLNIYHNGPSTREMDPSSISHTGGSQPVYKRSPFLTMKYCISTIGAYPPRS